MKKLIYLLLASVIFLSGCGKKVEKSDKPVVYTSFYPIYSMANDIAGDTLDIKNFMPLDKDPHFWEPTPKDMKRLQEADLLIINGANMEKWVDQVKENLPNLDIVNLGNEVDLITYKGAAQKGDFSYMAKFDKNFDKIQFGHTHEDHMRVCFFKANKLSKDQIIEKGKELMKDEGVVIKQHDTVKIEEETTYKLMMGHESGDIFFDTNGQEYIMIADRVSEPVLSYYPLAGDKTAVLETILEHSTSGLEKITHDPHSWMSVINGKKYLIRIFDKFVEKYPDNKRLYTKNKVRLVGDLTELEHEYKEKFKTTKRKEFVTMHYAYAYLARDFGLNQFPLTSLVSTEAPTLKAIRKAISYCKELGINTIFYETGKSSKGAQVLAEEIDAKYVPLTSMEFVRNTDLSYKEVLEQNLEKLYESMK